MLNDLAPNELALAAQAKWRTWRAAATATGVPYATLWRMAQGKDVSPATVECVRAALARKPGEMDALTRWRNAVSNPKLADSSGLMVKVGELREIIRLADRKG